MSDVLIVTEAPPNIEEIKKVYPLQGNEIFAYDGVIFNPCGDDLARPLIEHEKVHFAQQKEFGGAKLWWDKYLEDPDFMLAQEIPAHQAEYRQVKRQLFHPEMRNRLRMQIAMRLAGKLYLNKITLQKALRLIK